MKCLKASSLFNKSFRSLLVVTAATSPGWGRDVPDGMNLIPAHANTPAFWADTTEVTQQAWNSLMSENPSQNECMECPVERVSWHMAAAYANALSKSLGLTLPGARRQEFYLFDFKGTLIMRIPEHSTGNSRELLDNLKSGLYIIQEKGREGTYRLYLK